MKAPVLPDMIKKAPESAYSAEDTLVEDFNMES